jgi:hypothetical protein
MQSAECKTGNQRYQPSTFNYQQIKEAGCACLENRVRTTEVGALPTPSATLTTNERNPMKPVIGYQSRLLFRKSYKPKRVIRIRPGVQTGLVFRPARAAPENKTYECETY